MQQDLDSWERADIGVICDKCHKKTDTFLVWDKYKICESCNVFLQELISPISEKLEETERERALLNKNYYELIEAFFNVQ